MDFRARQYVIDTLIAWMRSLSMETIKEKMDYILESDVLIRECNTLLEFDYVPDNWIVWKQTLDMHGPTHEEVEIALDDAVVKMYVR